jgi:hypothetical protein
MSEQTAPPLPKQAPHPSGPVALLHGVAYTDSGFVSIDEPRGFRAKFGDEATIRTAAAFIEAWGPDVHAAWLDAVATWRELRKETAEVDAWEARNQ